MQAPKLKISMKLHKAQQEVYDDPHRFKIVVFGRQSGKSYLARYMCLEGAANLDKKVMWVSPSIPSARTHWNEIVRLLSKSKYPVLIKQTSKEIFFPNGGYLVVRSAQVPDNLRGDSLDLIVCDEAAFYPNGEYLWDKVLVPMVTATKGSIVLCTTPKGRNWVYNLFELGLKPNPFYKSFRITSYDSPYQDKALLDEIRRTRPDKKFREEYLAEFIADSGGVFSKIEEAAVTPHLDKPLANGRYVCGIDWANEPDYTALVTIDIVNRSVVNLKRFNGMYPNEQIQAIREHMYLWYPEIIVVEKNGLGETFFRLLQSELRDTSEGVGLDEVSQQIEIRFKDVYVAGFKLRGVHWNSAFKRDAVDRLAADIELGRFKLLSTESREGQVMISEFSTYERRVTKAGNIEYGAQEGATDDTVMATVLAYLAVPKVRFDNAPNVSRKAPPVSVKKNPFKKGTKYAKRR